MMYIFKFQALEVGIGKKLDEKSKSDVLELLSELEGELEGKDIAIATLKVNNTKICIKYRKHGSSSFSFNCISIFNY